MKIQLCPNPPLAPLQPGDTYHCRGCNTDVFLALSREKGLRALNCPSDTIPMSAAIGVSLRDGQVLWTHGHEIVRVVAKEPVVFTQV